MFESHYSRTLTRT